MPDDPPAGAPARSAARPLAGAAFDVPVDTPGPAGPGAAPWLPTALLEALPQAVYALDRDARVLAVNAAATRLLGTAAAALIGQHFATLHRPARGGRARAAPAADCAVCRAALRGESHDAVRDVFWRTDGTPLDVEYAIAPLLHAGLLEGAVLTFAPLAARLRAEAATAQGIQALRAELDTLERERDHLRGEVRESIYGEPLVARSALMQRAVQRLEAAAVTSASVLLQGEAGAGKLRLAAELHARSHRRDMPLLRVNCLAADAAGLETRLFAPGSGCVALARGGTLLLQHVDALPAPLQERVQRMLAHDALPGQAPGAGGGLDLRVVATCRGELAAAVRARRFREDLYLRLSVIVVPVPALRERSADLDELAGLGLRRACQGAGRAPLHLGAAALARLRGQSWPGNVRELLLTLEQAVLAGDGPRRALPTSGASPGAAVPGAAARADTLGVAVAGGEVVRSEAEMRAAERANLLAALRRCAGRVAGAHGAARLLGIKPSTLDYRMKALGISRAEALAEPHETS